MSDDFLALDIQPRIDAIIGELRELEGRVDRGLKAGLREGVKPVKRNVKQEAPSDQGALRRSIGHRTVPRRDMLALQLDGDAALFVGPTRKATETLTHGTIKKRSQVYKARFIEKGVRAHVITASGALKFGTGGGTVFANKVRHPGTQADPFIQRGWNRSGAAFQRSFYRGLQNYLDQKQSAA